MHKWQLLEFVQGEWAIVPDERRADHRRWMDGWARYEASDAADTPSMRRAAGEMCHGLKYELAGPPLLSRMDDDPPDRLVQQTVWRVIAGTLMGGENLGDEDRKRVRLALHVAKLRNYRHSAWGGNGTLDRLFESKYAYHTFHECLGDPPWEVDVGGFFEAPPGANFTFSD